MRQPQGHRQRRLATSDRQRHLPAVSGAPSRDVTSESQLERVLAVLRELALELGGPRALRAVSPTASLEREVGLGSLERHSLGGVDSTHRDPAAAPRHSSHRRQLLGPSHQGGRGSARGAPARHAALHPHVQLVAQPDRALVCQDRAGLHCARHLYLHHQSAPQTAAVHPRPQPDLPPLPVGLHQSEAPHPCYRKKRDGPLVTWLPGLCSVRCLEGAWMK